MLGNGGKSSSSASNGGGIDIMSVIQMLNKTKGGNGMNINLNDAISGIDMGGLLKQIGGSGSGSSDLINVILKQVLGGATANKNNNMGINSPSGNGGMGGMLGNMTTGDIASMAQGAAVILGNIMGNKNR